MLKLLRKSAIDFTPNAGSNISFDTDHLKCDDYLISDKADDVAGRGMARRTDGAFRMVNNGWNLSKYNSLLEYDGNLVLLNSAGGWVMGITIDDDNNIWIGHWASPSVLQKYDDAGNNTDYALGGILGRCKGLYFNPTDSYIYFSDVTNHQIHVIDKNGNLIQTKVPNQTYSMATFIDDTGIYTHEYYRLQKYDLSFNFVETILNTSAGTPTIPGWCCYYMAGLVRMSNGHFVARTGDSNNFDVLVELDSSGQYVRTLSVWGRTYPEKGEIAFDYNVWPNALIMSSDQKTLWVMSQYANPTSSYSRIIQMDIRTSSERYATMQHDFGSSVNITRLNINALYDNRDESWKSMRLWYQLDSGGYVEVDIKNPVLDINGQVLDLKVGMTSYGFLRNWPEFYSVDVVYEDNVPPPIYVQKLHSRAI